MHADHFLRAASLGRQFGDGNRGSVGGQNDFDAAKRIELAEELLLDGEFFRGRFDDEIAAFERGQLGCGTNALQRPLALAGGNFALGDLALQILADGFERAVEKALLHVAQQNLKAALSKDMGNAVAHRARAQHAYGFNFHSQSCRSFTAVTQRHTV